MAISKLILNGEVQMDVTSDTVSAGNMLSGITGTKKDGTKATGNIATRTSANLTASGSTVTAAAGYYATSVSKSVAAGSAFPPAVTITKNPTFSFVSSTGKITASYTGSSSVTPTVTSGYVTAGTAGTISTTGTSTYTLTTQAAQTLYPSTADQTVASYRWLTGAQTFKSVTTSNLTAENIAEGVVVKVGDSGNASRITQVTGTHRGGITHTATITGTGHNNGCCVIYNNVTYYQASSFTFNVGDTLQLRAIYKTDDYEYINVTINGIPQGSTYTSHTESYRLPDCDITIELSQDYTTLTREILITPTTIDITTDGTYDVTSYGVANVNNTPTYVATISGNGNSNYCYVQTNNGTKYYTNKSTFTFKEGDILILYSRGGDVRIDNSDKLPLTPYSYSYSLPSHDITIALTYSSTTSNSVHLYTSHYMGYIVSTVNTDCYITYNSNNYSEYGTKIIFKHGDSVTIRATNSAGTQGTDIYLNGEKVANASSTATTYTFTPNQHFEIRWTDSSAYIITYKLYTCTIGTTSGTGKTLKYNGINYGANTTFQFKAGDICLINAYGQYGGGTIYEDGVQIGTSDLDQMYTYILPASNIKVTISGNGSSTVNINKEISNEYSIYKALVTMKRLNSTGSSTVSYQYTSTDINNFCNSFSTMSMRTFEGVGFYGSFYFNNVASIPAYCFGSAWGGGGTINGAQSANFYFPKVSKIDSGAFIYNRNINFIEASSCALIEAYAFKECTYLTNIDFPNCSFISDMAFDTCSELTNISFSECLTISTSAFRLCAKLTSISFPKCSIIGTGAFWSCSYLTSAIFPECTTIKSSAFQSCTRLTTISFPKCTIISGYVFSNCSSLTAASFSQCTYVGLYAFYGCSLLTTAIFPSCTQISTGAFQRCYILSNISFPQCTSIGGAAFSSCGALEQINLPQCSIVGLSAFMDCSSLITVSLPICISIGNNTFQRCVNLISLYLNNISMVPSIGINTFISTPISTYSTVAGRYGSVFVPSSLYANFLANSLWKSYSARLVSV